MVYVHPLLLAETVVILAKAAIQYFKCLLQPPVKPEDDKSDFMDIL
jgi:hypothetical protein